MGGLSGVKLGAGLAGELNYYTYPHHHHYSYVKYLANLESFLKLFFFLIYLAAVGVSCGIRDLQYSLRHVGSSSLTRNGTPAPCIGSVESVTGPPGKSCKPGLF